LHLPIASMPHEDVMNAIRIYGEEVVPKVKTYFQKKTEQDRLKLKWKN
ncbi:MAG: 5,10-methylene tetrahydromethanopterin reductase, partial [Lactobacillus crispatus]|nr:5,10-methylene tetrahydromethanopterin reductase [Lactobacillus crispatus]